MHANQNTNHSFERFKSIPGLKFSCLFSGFVSNFISKSKVAVFALFFLLFLGTEAGAQMYISDSASVVIVKNSTAVPTENADPHNLTIKKSHTEVISGAYYAGGNVYDAKLISTHQTKKHLAVKSVEKIKSAPEPEVLQKPKVKNYERILPVDKIFKEDRSTQFLGFNAGSSKSCIPTFFPTAAKAIVSSQPSEKIIITSDCKIAFNYSSIFYAKSNYFSFYSRPPPVA